MLRVPATVFPDLGITLPPMLVAVRLALLDSTTCASHHLALWFKFTIKHVLAAGDTDGDRPIPSPLGYNVCRSFYSHSSSIGMGSPESRLHQTNRGYVVAQ